jgi:RNA polymerase sigma factor (sigma-70 family)
VRTARPAPPGHRALAGPSAVSGAAPEPASDAELVQLLGSGDQQALAELYDRHHLACYRLAGQITADHAFAEDAVQEAFTAMWRTQARYLGGRGSVRSWLLSMTHNKAVDLVRRETAEQRRHGAQAAQQAVDTGTDDDDPAAIIWAEIRAAEVRAALGRLPEAQRQALTLAYFGGYTQSQIAELTGIPLGTIKFRMSSAMKQLRLALSPLASVAGDELGE